MATPTGRRRGRPRNGAGRPGNAMTPATTRLATASTTSIATYSTTTCGHWPARLPTSRHPKPNWADSTGECSSGLRSRPTGLEPQLEELPQVTGLAVLATLADYERRRT